MSAEKATVNHNLRTYPDANVIYDKLRSLENVITEDMSTSAEKLGTHLTGLEYSVKTASSIKDKFARNKKKALKKKNDFIPSHEISEMKDIIRYTEIGNHEDLIPLTQRTIKEIELKGYVLSGLTNYYADPFRETQYMGIHLNFITPYGNEIEFQVHSQESFDAKQKGHDLYEKIRAVSTPIEEKDRLIKEIVKIHQSISRPPGYKSLSNVKMNEKKKRRIMQERASRTQIHIGHTRHQMTWDIQKDGQQVSKGYESTFTDGSVWKYNFNKESGRGQFSALTKEGDVTAREDRGDIEITQEFLEQEWEKQTKAHQEWMERNMSQEREAQKEQDIQILAPDDPGQLKVNLPYDLDDPDQARAYLQYISDAGQKVTDLDDALKLIKVDPYCPGIFSNEIQDNPAVREAAQDYFETAEKAGMSQQELGDPAQNKEEDLDKDYAMDDPEKADSQDGIDIDEDN